MNLFWEVECPFTYFAVEWRGMPKNYAISWDFLICLGGRNNGKTKDG